MIFNYYSSPHRNFLNNRIVNATNQPAMIIIAYIIFSFKIIFKDRT